MAPESLVSPLVHGIGAFNEGREPIFADPGH